MCRQYSFLVLRNGDVKFWATNSHTYGMNILRRAGYKGPFVQLEVPPENDFEVLVDMLEEDIPAWYNASRAAIELKAVKLAKRLHALSNKKNALLDEFYTKLESLEDSREAQLGAVQDSYAKEIEALETKLYKLEVARDKKLDKLYDKLGKPIRALEKKNKKQVQLLNEKLTGFSEYV